MDSGVGGGMFTKDGDLISRAMINGKRPLMRSSFPRLLFASFSLLGSLSPSFPAARFPAKNCTRILSTMYLHQGTYEYIHIYHRDYILVVLCAHSYMYNIFLCDFATLLDANADYIENPSLIISSEVFREKSTFCLYFIDNKLTIINIDNVL